MTKNKLDILVIHGLAAKPSPKILKAHVLSCLKDVTADQVDLLYWADLAGWDPSHSYSIPSNYAKPTFFSHLIRKLRGLTRGLAVTATEHAIAVALGLDPVVACGSKFLVSPKLFAAPLEREARLLFGLHLTELANYFQKDSYLRARIVNQCHSEGIDLVRYDLIIGHSMGSIIMADLLQQGVLQPTENIITIGSPLGLGVVQHVMKEYCPALHPMSECYSGKWINVSDPLDIVALDASLNGEYEGCRIEDVSIENDALTLSRKPYFHSLYGYLRSEPVQQLVRRML